VPPTPAPSPHPSPDCGEGTHLFSVTFKPSGADWAGVVSSVYLGTWTGEEPEEDNTLLAQLSDPYPGRDYLCISTTCYTILFEFEGLVDVSGLTFEIASEADTQSFSIAEHGDRLAFCADAETGEFDHAPSAAPTISAPPSPAPSEVPSPSPTASPAPTPVGIEWTNATEPFDCSTTAGPLQVLSEDGGSTFIVAEVDLETGKHVYVHYELNVLKAHMGCVLGFSCEGAGPRGHQS